MKQNKRMIAYIIMIAMGVALTVCGYTENIDEYWGGMGTALAIVGCLRLIRQIRYKTNASYKEEVDVQTDDERNKYLRIKAWSWAGYAFVLIAAFASVILKVFAYDQYSLIASAAVCLVVVLYWVSYLILSKKY